MRIAVLLAFLMAFPAVVHGRPSRNDGYRPELPPAEARLSRGATLFRVEPLSTTTAPDTAIYGGTCWAADSLRWEALRDSLWTFDTGVGSAIETGVNPNKVVGYHRLMEGWFGIDQTLNPLPYFRRTNAGGTGGAVASACAITTSGSTTSMWAGVALSEANSLCYVSGQGYGNAWHVEIEKTFSYPGAGNVTLQYDYKNDTENGFDFTSVVVSSTTLGEVVVATYTSAIPQTHASLTLQPPTTLPGVAENVTIHFVVDSDGSYSDEDGLNPTTCGAFVVDNVNLTGAIVDATDFEASSNGWSPVIATTGVRDFSNIVNRNTDLPPTTTFCACGVKDSVLVFEDPVSGHPLNQDNIAASPWINLKRNGGPDLNRPGRLMMYSVYAETPLANYVLTQLRARWYPSVCSTTGLVYRTPWKDTNTVFYFGETPFCTGPGISRLTDFSSVIETGAEQIQVAWGVINFCATAPFGVPCSGVTNSTPWFDNLALGIYGTSSAPNLTLTTFDYLQDSFATGGTLSYNATGRVDTNALKNSSTPGPGSILRDTLVARGDGGNTEARLVFHVRPGPFISASALNAWATKWTVEPSLGSGWYSARMDTAEQGGVKGTTPGFMSCFHESDPGFSGTDRSPDPVNPSQNLNEILPDNILTPGSRIDYFIAARYLPPDPRNPGGNIWHVFPDTTGRRYAEMEVLPSSMGADSTWNCTLYVDHHDDRARDQQIIEEQGLTLSLGVGSPNAEGTRYDRWDVQTPSSGQLSFGRPIQTSMGASLTQTFAYKVIVWHSATLSSVQLVDEDANILGPWLTLRGIGNNRFWGSGDGLATSMNGSGEPSTVNFMKATLGVLRTCNTIRDANCPSGAALDSTYCLPLGAVAGSHFVSNSASARGNGCPDLLSFDLLNVNASVASAKGQQSYLKNAAPVNFASVSNWNTIDVDYRTVLDGCAVGVLRNVAANPHLPVNCTSAVPSTSRTDAILDWFSPYSRCFIPRPQGEEDPGNPGSPKYRAHLGAAWPNPMGASTKITFEVPSPGARARIEVFDVTGRLVRTLLDGAMTEGVHEIGWDGRDKEGNGVAAGMYFYKLRMGPFTASKKLVVLR